MKKQLTPPVILSVAKNLIEIRLPRRSLHSLLAMTMVVGLLIFVRGVSAGHLGGEGWFCEGGDIVYEAPNGDHEPFQYCPAGTACVERPSSQVPAGFTSDADCLPETATNQHPTEAPTPGQQVPGCGIPHPLSITECIPNTTEVGEVYQDDCGNHSHHNVRTQPGVCGAPQVQNPFAPVSPVPGQTYYECDTVSRSCTSTTIPKFGSYGDIATCNRLCKPVPTTAPIQHIPPRAFISGPSSGYPGEELIFHAAATGVNLQQLMIVSKRNGQVETLASTTCSGTSCPLDFGWWPNVSEVGSYQISVVAFEADGETCSGNPDRDPSYGDCGGSDFIDVTVSEPPVTEAPTQPGSPPTATLSGPDHGMVGDRLTFNANALGSDLTQIGIWIALQNSDLSNAGSWRNLVSGSCSGNDCSVSKDWEAEEGSWIFVVRAFGSAGQCSGSPASNPSNWSDCSPGEVDLVRITISPPPQAVTQPAQTTQRCNLTDDLGPCNGGENICVNSTSGPAIQCIPYQAGGVSPGSALQTGCTISNLGATFDQCHEGLAVGINRCVLNSQHQPVLECTIPPQAEAAVPVSEQTVPTPTLTPVEPVITSLEETLNGSNYDLNGQSIPFGSRISIRAHYPSELGVNFVCRWSIDGGGDSIEDCQKDLENLSADQHTVSVYIQTTDNRKSNVETVSFRVNLLPTPTPTATPIPTATPTPTTAPAVAETPVVGTAGTIVCQAQISCLKDENRLNTGVAAKRWFNQGTTAGCPAEEQISDPVNCPEGQAVGGFGFTGEQRSVEAPIIPPPVVTAVPETPQVNSCNLPEPTPVQYECENIGRGLRCFNDFELDPANCQYKEHINADNNHFHCVADLNCKACQKTADCGPGFYCPTAVGFCRPVSAQAGSQQVSEFQNPIERAASGIAESGPAQAAGNVVSFVTEHPTEIVTFVPDRIIENATNDIKTVQAIGDALVSAAPGVAQAVTGGAGNLADAVTHFNPEEAAQTVTGIPNAISEIKSDFDQRVEGARRDEQRVGSQTEDALSRIRAAIEVDNTLTSTGLNAGRTDPYLIYGDRETLDRAKTIFGASPYIPYKQIIESPEEALLNKTQNDWAREKAKAALKDALAQLGIDPDVSGKEMIIGVCDTTLAPVTKILDSFRPYSACYTTSHLVPEDIQSGYAALEKRGAYEALVKELGLDINNPQNWPPEKRNFLIEALPSRTANPVKLVPSVGLIPVGSLAGLPVPVSKIEDEQTAHNLCLQAHGNLCDLWAYDAGGIVKLTDEEVTRANAIIRNPGNKIRGYDYQPADIKLIQQYATSDYLNLYPGNRYGDVNQKVDPVADRAARERLATQMGISMVELDHVEDSYRAYLQVGEKIGQTPEAELWHEKVNERNTDVVMTGAFVFAGPAAGRVISPVAEFGLGRALSSPVGRAAIGALGIENRAGTEALAALIRKEAGSLSADDQLIVEKWSQALGDKAGDLATIVDNRMEALSSGLEKRSPEQQVQIRSQIIQESMDAAGIPRAQQELLKRGGYQDLVSDYDRFTSGAGGIIDRVSQTQTQGFEQAVETAAPTVFKEAGNGEAAAKAVTHEQPVVIIPEAANFSGPEGNVLERAQAIPGQVGDEISHIFDRAPPADEAAVREATSGISNQVIESEARTAARAGKTVVNELPAAGGEAAHSREVAAALEEVDAALRGEKPPALASEVPCPVSFNIIPTVYAATDPCNPLPSILAPRPENAQAESEVRRSLLAQVFTKPSSAKDISLDQIKVDLQKAGFKGTDQELATEAESISAYVFKGAEDLINGGNQTATRSVKRSFFGSTSEIEATEVTNKLEQAGFIGSDQELAVAVKSIVDDINRDIRLFHRPLTEAQSADELLAMVSQRGGLKSQYGEVLDTGRVNGYIEAVRGGNVAVSGLPVDQETKDALRSIFNSEAEAVLRQFEQSGSFDDLYFALGKSNGLITDGGERAYGARQLENIIEGIRAGEGNVRQLPEELRLTVNRLLRQDASRLEDGIYQARNFDDLLYILSRYRGLFKENGDFVGASSLYNRIDFARQAVRRSSQRDLDDALYSIPRENGLRQKVSQLLQREPCSLRFGLMPVAYAQSNILTPCSGNPLEVVAQNTSNDITSAAENIRNTAGGLVDRVLGRDRTQIPEDLSAHVTTLGPDTFYHGTTEPNLKIRTDITFTSAEISDVSPDGSLTLGSGFYSTINQDAASAYSIIRQYPASAIDPKTPAHVASFTAEGSRMYDLRSPSNPAQNLPVDRGLAERWLGRMEEIHGAKPVPETFLEEIRFNEEETQISRLRGLIDSNQGVDLRAMLGTDGNIGAPPWVDDFAQFMKSQGIDGAIYNEGGEAVTRGGKQISTGQGPTYVFYDLEHINQTNPCKIGFNLVPEVYAQGTNPCKPAGFLENLLEKVGIRKPSSPEGLSPKAVTVDEVIDPIKFAFHQGQYRGGAIVDISQVGLSAEEIARHLPDEYFHISAEDIMRGPGGIPKDKNIMVVTGYTSQLSAEERSLVERGIRGRVGQRRADNNPLKVLILTDSLPEHEAFHDGKRPWFNGPFDKDNEVWSLRRNGDKLELAQQKEAVVPNTGPGPEKFTHVWQDQKITPCPLTFNIFPTVYAAAESPCAVVNPAANIVEGVKGWVNRLFGREESVPPVRGPPQVEAPVVNYQQVKAEVAAVVASYPNREDLPSLISKTEQIMRIDNPVDRVAEVAQFVDDKYAVSRAIAGDSIQDISGLFGDRAYMGFLKAQATARAHTGPLSTDFLRQIHSDTSEFLDKFPDQPNQKSIGGRFRNEPYGGFPGLTPYTPEQIAEIENNPLLRYLPNRGVVEYPTTDTRFSDGIYSLSPEARRIFDANKTDSGLIEALLNDLVDWYTKELANPVHDPYALAAELQRRFISIHPFENNNGRASRILMNWALEREGLPPARVLNPDNDYLSSLPEWTKQVKEGSDRHRIFVDRASELEQAGITPTPAYLLGVEEEATFYRLLYDHLARAPPWTTEESNLKSSDYEAFLSGLKSEFDKLNGNFSGTMPFYNQTIGGLIPEAEIEHLTARPENYEAYQRFLRGNYFSSLTVYRGGVEFQAIKSKEEILRYFEEYTIGGASYGAIGNNFGKGTNAVSPGRVAESLHEYNRLLADEYLARSQGAPGTPLLDEVTTHAKEPGKAVGKSPFVSTSTESRISIGFARNGSSDFSSADLAQVKNGFVIKARLPKDGAIPTFPGDGRSLGIQAWEGQTLTNHPAENEILVPGGLHPASVNEVWIYDWGKDPTYNRGYGATGLAFEAKRVENSDGVFVSIVDHHTGITTDYKLNPQTGQFEVAPRSLDKEIESGVAQLPAEPAELKNAFNPCPVSLIPVAYAVESPCKPASVLDKVRNWLDNSFNREAVTEVPVKQPAAAPQINWQEAREQINSALDSYKRGEIDLPALISKTEEAGHIDKPTEIRLLAGSDDTLAGALINGASLDQLRGLRGELYQDWLNARITAKAHDGPLDIEFIRQLYGDLNRLSNPSAGEFELYAKYEAQLKDVITWYNQQFQIPHDPYSLAAELTQRIIPTLNIKGGRDLADLLMNWALEREGKAPARVSIGLALAQNPESWAQTLRQASEKQQFILDRARAFENAGIKPDPATSMGLDDRVAFYNRVYSQIAQSPPLPKPGEASPEYQNFLRNFEGVSTRFDNDYSGVRTLYDPNDGHPINIPVGGLIPDSTVSLLTANPQDREAYERFLRDHYYTERRIFRGGMTSGLINTEAQVLRMFEGDNYSVGASNFAINNSYGGAVSPEAVRQSFQRYNRLMSNEYLENLGIYKGEDTMLRQIDFHSNKPEDPRYWDSPFASWSLREITHWATEWGRKDKPKSGIMLEARAPKNGAIFTFGKENKGMEAWKDTRLSKHPTEEEVLVPGAINPAAIDSVKIYHNNPHDSFSEDVAFEAKKIVNEDGIFVTIRDNEKGKTANYKLNAVTGKYEPTTIAVDEQLQVQASLSLEKAIANSSDAESLYSALSKLKDSGQLTGKFNDVVEKFDSYWSGNGSIFDIPKDFGLRDKVEQVVSASSLKNYGPFYLNSYLKVQIKNQLDKMPVAETLEKSIKFYMSPDGTRVTASRLQAPPGSYEVNATLKLNSSSLEGEVTDITFTEGMPQKVIDNIKLTIETELNHHSKTPPNISTVPRKTTLSDKIHDSYWNIASAPDEGAYHFRTNVRTFANQLNELPWWAYDNVGFYKSYVDWFDKHIYNTHK